MKLCMDHAPTLRIPSTNTNVRWNFSMAIPVGSNMQTTGCSFVKKWRQQLSSRNGASYSDHSISSFGYGGPDLRASNYGCECADPSASDNSTVCTWNLFPGFHFSFQLYTIANMGRLCWFLCAGLHVIRSSCIRYAQVWMTQIVQGLWKCAVVEGCYSLCAHLTVVWLFLIGFIQPIRLPCTQLSFLLGNIEYGNKLRD